MMHARRGFAVCLRVWIWPFAVVAGVLAWWCPRGSDGRFLGSLVGFGAIGLIYGTLMLTGRPVPLVTGLMHLAVLEGVVLLTLRVDPQLDEMGGMLNVLIPAYVAGIVVAGWLLQAMIPRSVGPKGRANQRSQQVG